MYIKEFRKRYGECTVYPMHKKDRREIRLWALGAMERLNSEGEDARFFKLFEKADKWLFVEDWNGKPAVFCMAGNEVLVDEEADMMPRFDVCHKECFIRDMFAGEVLNPSHKVVGRYQVKEDLIVIVVEFKNKLDNEYARELADEEAKKLGYPIFTGDGQIVADGKAVNRKHFFYRR